MKRSIAWLAIVGACGPATDDPEQVDGDTSSGAAAQTSTATSVGEDSDATGTSTSRGDTTSTSVEPDADSGAGAYEDDGADDGCAFTCPPLPPPPGGGGGGVNVECDVWAQDCPEGQKCMPYATDGGLQWNGTRCFDVADRPHDVGEPCTVEGGPASGIDDCALGAMCWFVDAQNAGTCVESCGGSEANPVCEDPSAACMIGGEGTVIACVPSCDPLLQDCADGFGCYPAGSGFFCALDTSGPQGGLGDGCPWTSVCDPGFVCAEAAMVPDCVGVPGCCAPFCDVGIADGPCPRPAQCVSLAGDGSNPGVCLLPG